MDERLRKTGIDIIGDAPWGSHFCQFYQSKEDLIDISAPYFKAGLEDNKFCLWVVSEPLKVGEAKAALKRVVEGLDEYIQKGQIEIIDGSQWPTEAGKFEADKVLGSWVEKERQAVRRGYDGLRFAGDTLFWFKGRNWKNFTEYEKEADNVIGKYRIIAICSYSLDRCGASEIIEVVGNHPLALGRQEGRWKVIESSERKLAREALGESEEKFRLLTKELLDSLAVGIFILDADFRVVWMNQALERYFSLKRKETLGKDKRQLIRERIKDIFADPECFVEKVFATHDNNTYIENFECHVLPDGEREERWLEHRSQPIQSGFYSGGRIEHYYDITKRKQAEIALKKRRNK